MTNLEAFKQAARERGDAEPEIELRISAMNVINPSTHWQQVVPPGMERDLINFLKSIMAQIAQRLEQEPEVVLREMNDQLLANQRSN